MGNKSIKRVSHRHSRNFKRRMRLVNIILILLVLCSFHYLNNFSQLNIIINFKYVLL